MYFAPEDEEVLAVVDTEYLLLLDEVFLSLPELSLLPPPIRPRRRRTMMILVNGFRLLLKIVTSSMIGKRNIHSNIVPQPMFDLTLAGVVVLVTVGAA